MEKATVFFTPEITPESLLQIYHALQRPLTGKVAIKISTGEPGGHNFLQPQLIGALVQELHGTIVECNTAYEGRRSTTEAHWKAIAEHGFPDIAPLRHHGRRRRDLHPRHSGTPSDRELRRRASAALPLHAAPFAFQRPRHGRLRRRIEKHVHRRRLRPWEGAFTAWAYRKNLWTADHDAFWNAWRKRTRPSWTTWAGRTYCTST